MTLDDRPDLRLELARQLHNSAARGIDPIWENQWRIEINLNYLKRQLFWLAVMVALSFLINAFTLAALLYAVLE